MNQLQKAIIEKIGHDFGFEYLVSESEHQVVLGSARHLIHAAVSVIYDAYQIEFSNAKSVFIDELARNFVQLKDNLFSATNESQLATLFKRASQLANSLPNQAANNYEKDLKAALAELPLSTRGTEIERMVRQRVGQDAYRKAMLDYWGNACAVTGLQMPEVLRASHAKPWADCATDSERLDVYNGFLLTANLDALFDRFLISFDGVGHIMISDSIKLEQQNILHINTSLRLRWISLEHENYLIYHRGKFQLMGAVI